MGRCGCGDFDADFKLQGPDEVVYGIAVYRGCSSCGNPAGIMFHKMDKADQELWDMDNVPELKILPHGRLLCVLDPEEVKEGLLSFAEEMFSEAITENLFNATQAAINKNKEGNAKTIL